MLQRVMLRYHNAQAFTWCEGGVWQHVSHGDFFNLIHRMALGLRALGVQQGDCVGIFAHSSPYWMITDFAIQIAGGITVPLFSHISDKDLTHIIQETDMAFCFVNDEHSWLQLKELAVPCLHTIIQRHINSCHPLLLPLKSLLAQGDASSTENPCAYAALRDSVQPEDVATIIYTSGSTGVPKGVCLSHHNLVSQIAGARQCFHLDSSTDKALSVLPLAHIFERVITLVYLDQGVPICFGDDIFRTGDLLKQFQPTLVTMVPRLLEKIHAKIMSGIDTSNSLSRSFASWAMRQAHDHSDSFLNDWSALLADKAVYSRIREELGGKIRQIITGGAALAPHLQELFTNMGIPIYPGYGMTECSPVISCNYPGSVRTGTVGQAFPGVEIYIDTNGEILARGAGLMVGYYKDKEKTYDTIDVNGWLHTGDKGSVDNDGFLSITGRIKEQFKTANGKYVAPAPLEVALCTHSLIDNALILGAGKSFVSCLLFCNPELQITERLTHAIQEHIDEINANSNHWEQIRDFRLIPYQLSIGTNELTPTLKLRRFILEHKFADDIASLYHPHDPSTTSANARNKGGHHD